MKCNKGTTMKTFYEIQVDILWFYTAIFLKGIKQGNSISMPSDKAVKFRWT